MRCKAAYSTDEFHGWACKITGGECMFLFPDSAACAERFSEGPEADLEPAPSKDDLTDPLEF